MTGPTTPHTLTPAALAYVRQRYPAHLTDAADLARLVSQAAAVAAMDGRLVVSVSDLVVVETRRAEAIR